MRELDRNGSVAQPETIEVNRPGSRKLTLGELFLVITVAAVLVTVYQTISPEIALLATGALLAAGVVRWTGCESVVLSGLIGFLVFTILAYLIVVSGGNGESARIALMVLCAPAGYVIGACLAELQVAPTD